MKELNTDLRVLRTKTSIRNALTELIEEKGFEAITVKDITVKAEINRGTFYLHYQDKYDLMDKCQQEIMYQMATIAKTTLSKGVLDSELAFSFAISIFEYLSQNADFMKAVLGPKGDLSFQIKIKEFMRKTLFEDSEQNSFIKQEALLVPEGYLTSYISSAHLGVVQQWLQYGRKESPQEMARILSTMTYNGPLFAAGLKK
ncbi:TetR/AcrR family transcriptional regulator [Priestia endophytica]|uniref:TetR/AcrR family transcriptional regulator n=1 Tax=Priestia endophytica TaxID=135735 RepID=UPI00124C0BBB|nr:TetR/AcrR family transcriptional regulator [Priestia endophytica]KAB2494262.1 TetR/AcrR family transcriptional regulator [Priestia endophytica]